MSAVVIEPGAAPRCGECGMPLSMHHDPGCSQPCNACKKVGRHRQRRELGFALALAAAGLMGGWLPYGLALNALHGALVWAIGLATGCFAAMGRQRAVERRSRR